MWSKRFLVKARKREYPENGAKYAKKQPEIAHFRLFFGLSDWI